MSEDFIEYQDTQEYDFMREQYLESEEQQYEHPKE